MVTPCPRLAAVFYVNRNIPKFDFVPPACPLGIWNCSCDLIIFSDVHLNNLTPAYIQTPCFRIPMLVVLLHSSFLCLQKQLLKFGLFSSLCHLFRQASTLQFLGVLLFLCSNLGWGGGVLPWIILWVGVCWSNYQ